MNCVFMQGYIKSVGNLRLGGSGGKQFVTFEMDSEFLDTIKDERTVTVVVFAKKYMYLVLNLGYKGRFVTVRGHLAFTKSDDIIRIVADEIVFGSHTTDEIEMKDKVAEYKARKRAESPETAEEEIVLPDDTLEVL